MGRGKAVQVNEIEKSQAVRLLDVFAVGPLMIWSAQYAPKELREIMTILGAATIIYNGANWIANRSQQNQGRTT